MLSQDDEISTLFENQLCRQKYHKSQLLCFSLHINISLTIEQKKHVGIFSLLALSSSNCKTRHKEEEWQRQKL